MVSAVPTDLVFLEGSAFDRDKGVHGKRLGMFRQSSCWLSVPFK